MPNAHHFPPEQNAAGIMLSIILGSLICFILLWLQLFSMIDAVFKTEIFLPVGVCLIFLVSGFGGWLYLRTSKPEKSLCLKIFLLTAAACSVIVPFLLEFSTISTSIPMVLTILVPLLYLLFAEVFPENTKYLRLLKYFAVFVAGYGLVIGFCLSFYVLSQEFGSSPMEMLSIFSVASSLVLLPIFGLVFIGVGWNSSRTNIRAS